MAAPPCTMCEEYQGVLMATNLEDGDTVIVCGNCLPAYALGLAAAVTANMPPEAADVYAAGFDAIYGNDPRPKTFPVKSAKSKLRGQTLTPATGQPSAPDAKQESPDSTGSANSDHAADDAVTHSARQPESATSKSPTPLDA